MWQLHGNELCKACALEPTSSVFTHAHAREHTHTREREKERAERERAKQNVSKRPSIHSSFPGSVSSSGSSSMGLPCSAA